jgi:hypothetical protein
MDERWKPVVGFEGRYEVSDLGRVRSLMMPTGTGRRCRAEPLVLKPRSSRSGHLRVCLGRRTDRLIHRLVLAAFRGPCPNGFDGSHLNGKPADNRLVNLVWESRADNFARKREHRTHNGGEANPRAKLKQSDVDAIHRACKAGETQTSVARRYGVAQSTVSRIRRGLRWAG